MMRVRIRSLVVLTLLLRVFTANGLAQEITTLPARDSILRDVPALVFRIGARDGKSWETLGRIADVAFDGEENIYVLDNQIPRVLVFDAQGRFVREFGREGNGPGEFRLPTALEVTEEGYVAVLDRTDRAIELFQPDGGFAGTVRFVDHHYNRPIQIAADPRGGLIASAQAALDLREAEPSPRKSVLYHFRLSASPDRSQPTAGRDEVTSRFELPLPQPIIRRPSSTSKERYTIAVDVPPVFSAAASWGVLPDGSLAVHHEDSYAIKVIGPDGRHVRTFARPFQPRTVTSQDIEAELRRNERGQPGAASVAAVTGFGPSVRLNPGPRGYTATTGSGAPIPVPEIPFADVMSVVTGISTDVAGRIWVQRRAEDGTNHGPVDIIGPDGRYVGTLPPGQRVPLAVSAGGLAAYLELDDMDVPYLVVRRLPASWR